VTEYNELWPVAIQGDMSAMSLWMGERSTSDSRATPETARKAQCDQSWQHMPIFNYNNPTKGHEEDIVMRPFDSTWRQSTREKGYTLVPK